MPIQIPWIYGPFDVENQHQSSWKFVHPVNDLARGTLQSFRDRFKGVVLHLDHVADLIHQKTDGAIFGSHDHIHGELTGWQILHAQPAAKIDGRYDLAAQIDQSAHNGRYEGHARHFLITDNFPHLLHLHSENVSIEEECAELLSHQAAPIALGRNKLLDGSLLMVKINLRGPHDRGNVQQVRYAALNNHRSSDPVSLRRVLNDHVFLDNIENTVHYESDSATFFGVNDHLHGIIGVPLFRADLQNIGHAHERHDLAPVLRNVLKAGMLDSRGGEDFQPRNEVKRNRHAPLLADLNQKQRL